VFPRKDAHSVVITRQYCGQLGEQKNCRLVVSVALATEQTSLPTTYQPSLPEKWSNDAQGRKKARMPEEIHFQTKQEMALV
jgi:SRSO17 transposase